MRIRFSAAILVFCCLAIGCRGLAYKVVTTNMSPALNPGDGFIVNPLAYTSDPVERFDIVVFQAPEESKRRTHQTGDVRYVTRVIGLPGERIEIKENKIFINGELLNEPFERFLNEKDPKRNFPAITIPVGEYFLIGDNRPGSEDSRYYVPATIKKADVYSKLVRIYPGYYKED